MNQYEIYRRVINKLLNRELMNKYYYYDYVFYLNPIQYLLNREVGSNFGVVEIVSVNLKNTITISQRDKLSNDIKNCLNSINPYVEGVDYKQIRRVVIKSPQRICSGIILRNVF